MIKKLFLPAVLLTASVMFFSSCGKDCKFEQNDYTGQYAIDEDCSNSQAQSYTITVTANGETGVKIANFWGLFGAAVEASFDCETITIARQEPDGDGYFVEGSGFIEKADGVTSLTISYTVTDETDPANIKSDECSQSLFIKL
ncbi:MAG: hypothetical protein JNJ57_20965 [Saprospiraceae bacterium]|nr:hypothetical protein [Saprospiraceae bacterium]